MDTASTARLHRGTVFARYRVETLLADGDSGPLYRATDLSVGRPVALKVIRPEVASAPGFRERFLRAWRLAGSLDHPSVIPIHEAGEHDGHLFVAARLVDGVDLGTLVAREGGLKAPRAAHLLAKAAGALDAAHAHGLVHAGLTANDLLVVRAGEEQHVYVTGFHAAASNGEARSDLRALARVIATALDGSPARSGPVADIADGRRHAALRAVITRALATEPEVGYSSGRELARAARAAAPSPPVDDAADDEPGGLGPARDRVPPRIRMAAVAALSVMVLVVALAAVRSDGPAPAAAAPAGKIVGPPIRPGDGPWGVAMGGGFLWVANGLEDTVVRIDPRSHRPVGEPIPVGDAPHAIAYADSGVWVANNDDDTVVRVDPARGRVIGKPIEVGNEPAAIAIGAGDVWTYNLEGTVTRIDPRRMRVSGSPIVVGPPTHGGGLAFVAGKMWVTEITEDTLSAIDPASNRVVGRPVHVGDGPRGVTGLGDVVWVANSADSTAVAVDARTFRVLGEPVAAGPSPLAITAGAGAVWVVGDETLSRIDPRRMEVAGEPIPVADNANALTAGAGGIWVPHYDAGTVTHVVPSGELGR